MIQKVQNIFYEKWDIRISQTMIILIPSCLVLLVFLLAQLSMRTTITDVSPQDQLLLEKKMDEEIDQRGAIF